MQILKEANVNTESTGILSSLHNHSTFCDGKASMQEMAKSAYDAGITDFGFSSHGESYFDPEIKGVTPSNFDEYKKIIDEIKYEYNGKMRIYTSIEQDYYSPVDIPRKYLDYMIGSVHDVYSEKTGKAYWVDGSHEMLQLCIDELFDKNPMKLVEHFYALSVTNVKENKPDIIGHFDLIVKNNSNNKFFDENSKKYEELAIDALDECAKTDAIFELNTGAIFRKFRTFPYPANFLLKRLLEKKASVILSADSHAAEAVKYHFDESKLLLQEIGFKSIIVFANGKFVEQGI